MLIITGDCNQKKIRKNLESTLPPPHFYIGGHRLPHLKKNCSLGPDIIPEEIEFYIESDEPVSLKRQITYSIRENIFFSPVRLKYFLMKYKKETLYVVALSVKKEPIVRKTATELLCEAKFTLS